MALMGRSSLYDICGALTFFKQIGGAFIDKNGNDLLQKKSS